MSLLMNDDFSIYQLRLGYLNHIQDGVGERLINLNPAVLNNPAFRTAGWVPDTTAIKRCYSPPIPTGGGAEISSEYFQRPRRPIGGSALDEEGGEGGGGMVTGHQGSEDTLGPAGLHANERKRERRRRKEQLEEDDSSDLSDDSDEDELAKGPAQSIKFSKMPIRNRAKSSPPTQASTLKATFVDDGPEVMVTSPSRPAGTDEFGRARSGSLGLVEAVKQRARRGTITSSEVSSDNEAAPAVFKKKLPGRPGKGPSMLTIDDDIQEEEQDGQRNVNSDLDDEDEDDIDVDAASDLSDEFEGTAESPSMLGLPGVSDGMSTSPLKPPPGMLPAVSAAPNTSPKKQPRDALPRLPKLPPGQRPMSMAPQPVSMLSKMIKGSGGVSDKPFQKFAELSGKDVTSPLWIKIYAPFSEKPTHPIEVPIKRTIDSKPITVAELIGLALWRYVEQNFEPELAADESNVNWWTLRIVEDEEIDFDFPALVRTRPVVDFTSNNNKPPQRRARDKPWDEFGLVKATEEQFKENEQLTPQIGDPGSTGPAPLPTPKVETAPKVSIPQPISRATSDAPPTPNVSFNPARNPITGPSFEHNALRKDSSALLDMPQREGKQGASKTGATRTVIVSFTDPQTFHTRTESYETTTDSYIAEIFERSCAKLGLEKGSHVLKVHGSQTVAPLDRTVEALGDRLRLDLVRRRFMGGDGLFGLGLSGSPGSSSPNAPLDLTPANATPGHSKKKGGMKGFTLHPLAAQQKSELNTTSALTLTLDRDGKRYNVMRKQPLSFASTHPRTLIITPEYMTIMPAAPDSLAAPSGKVTNVPMTSIIGAKVSRKHTKMVRILVYREKEQKRYDFEALNHREAEEICADVRRGMEAFGPVGAYD